MALLLDVYGFVSVVLLGILLAAQSLALGGLAFQELLAGPLAAELGPSGAASLRRCGRLVRVSALAVAIVLAASLSIEVALLADSLGTTIRDALSAHFVRAGMVEIAAALAIAALCGSGRGRARRALAILAALVLVAAATATSHAAARLDERAGLLAATALHRLAAALWIGGLPYLLVALASCREPGAWSRIGRRFSALAIAGVAVLVASGLAMSWSYIGSLEGLYGTAYGVMVSAKGLLLAGLLGLGGLNFLALRRSAAGDPAARALRVRRFAEVELGVGITTLFVAGSLTSLPPAVDLTSDRVTLAEFAARLVPRWPSLETPDPSSLAFQELQAKLTAEAQSSQASAPVAYVPGAGLPAPRNAANIAWSEYNHHWSGVAVLAMGCLTLVELSRRGRFARHWPLLFVPMALFLMYRDDVESGLYDGLGPLAILRDPEFVQHRIFYFLIIVFGVFEWAVRTGRVRRRGPALVFPLGAAVAAGLLLTHAHFLTNLKELLLIEIMHVPLALIGIAFAWARWLELRAGSPESRVAGWTWRACFVAVGVLLLLYRES